jgi:hypothetical protein
VLEGVVRCQKVPYNTKISCRVNALVMNYCANHTIDGAHATEIQSAPGPAWPWTCLCRCLPELVGPLEILLLTVYIFGLVLQKCLEKKCCKKSSDLHSRQGNLLHRKKFSGLWNTSFTTKNRLEISLKKFAPFSTSRSFRSSRKEAKLPSLSRVWNTYLFICAFRSLHYV